MIKIIGNLRIWRWIIYDNDRANDKHAEHEINNDNNNDDSDNNDDIHNQDIKKNLDINASDEQGSRLVHMSRMWSKLL